MRLRGRALIKRASCCEYAAVAEARVGDVTRRAWGKGQRANDFGLQIEGHEMKDG
jgi:hypothetical protein